MLVLCQPQTYTKSETEHQEQNQKHKRGSYVLMKIITNDYIIWEVYVL